MFGGEGPDLAAWLASCRTVLDRYFDLEDPRRLEPAERELYVEALLDSKLLLRGFVDRVDVAPDGRIRVVDYKGLAVDTPLPTPTGWTTMGAVQVGDDLLGRDGRATRVVAKSQSPPPPLLQGLVQGRFIRRRRQRPPVEGRHLATAAPGRES